LLAPYAEIGFARSPDGRLKLLDGHRRRDVDPDMEADVETLGRSPHHATVVGLSPEAASHLLTPTIANPAKKP
jgi:hypothetical protein